MSVFSSPGRKEILIVLQICLLCISFFLSFLLFCTSMSNILRNVTASYFKSTISFVMPCMFVCLSVAKIRTLKLFIDSLLLWQSIKIIDVCTRILMSIVFRSGRLCKTVRLLNIFSRAGKT